MKKRVLAVILTAAMVLGAFTGCSSSGKDTPASGQAENSQAGGGNTETASKDEVQKVKIGMFLSRPLMSYYDDDGNLTGFEAEVLKAIDGKLENYEFEYVQTELASLFVSLEAGDVDMVCANFRRSDEREDKYIHTWRAYNSTAYYIIVQDTNTDINGIEDLEGKKVAIGQGSLMATILEHYVEKTGADIELVYSTDNVGDLLTGRVDAVIGPEIYVTIWNQSYDDVQFKSVGDAIASEEGNGSDNNAYLYLAKGSEDLRDAVSEAIYELRQEGKLSELALEFFKKDLTADIDESKELEQMEALGIQ